MIDTTNHDVIRLPKGGKRMKIKHGIILSIGILIATMIINDSYVKIDYELKDLLVNILGVLWLVSLFLIAYLIIRTIIQKISQAIKTHETRKICEKVTPRKDKYATPPWEE